MKEMHLPLNHGYTIPHPESLLYFLYAVILLLSPSLVNAWGSRSSESESRDEDVSRGEDWHFVPDMGYLSRTELAHDLSRMTHMERHIYGNWGPGRKRRAAIRSSLSSNQYSGMDNKVDNKAGEKGDKIKIKDIATGAKIDRDAYEMANNDQNKTIASGDKMERNTNKNEYIDLRPLCKYLSDLSLYVEKTVLPSIHLYKADGVLNKTDIKRLLYLLTAEKNICHKL